eukprot:jgi/Chlat1/8831/Chrsp91S08150
MSFTRQLARRAHGPLRIAPAWSNPAAARHAFNIHPDHYATTANTSGPPATAFENPGLAKWASGLFRSMRQKMDYGLAAPQAEKAAAFGKSVGSHDSLARGRQSRLRQFTMVWRATVIAVELGLLQIVKLVQPDIRKRAVYFSSSLQRLGPAFVKLGQAMSTRPDVVPPEICNELAKLQDQMEPFDSETAMSIVENDLGRSLSELFQYISDEPIAAASLGQVYKAQIAGTGEWVAVKVQRPNAVDNVTLDTHVLRSVAGIAQRAWPWLRGDLVGLVDELVGRVYDELDYIREGRNAEKFAKLYARPSAPGVVGIKAPKIYWSHTSRMVLTMEWIDGFKLTDHASIAQLKLDVSALADTGVQCSLQQLLGQGFFHADPHPGNLLVTPDGDLAYLDFGMMYQLQRADRVGLMYTLIHFVNQDAEALVEDFFSLGLMPDSVEHEAVVEALEDSFGTGADKVRMDFQGVISQLSSVMYQFGFRLPAHYSLVIRSLAALEGTASALDPSFEVVARAYPYVVSRLVSDRSEDTRKILWAMLLERNGHVRWNRLSRLVQVVNLKDGDVKSKATAASRTTTAQDVWTANEKDIALVVEDGIDFITAPTDVGRRIRSALRHDALNAADMYVATTLRMAGLKRGQGRSMHPITDADDAPLLYQSDESAIRELAHAFASLTHMVQRSPQIWLPVVRQLLQKEDLRDIGLTALCRLYNSTPSSAMLTLSNLVHELDKACRTRR